MQSTVCHVLHSLCVGGAEVLAARLGRWFTPSYRVVFVCLDSLGTLGETLQREGYTTHVLNRRPGFDWRCVIRLARILRDERVDIVHAHQYTPFLYAMMARWFAWRPAILFTEHGRHFPDHRRIKRVFANRFLLEGRDRVIGVGESVRAALIKNEGIPSNRVGVVCNGIDLSQFCEIPQNAAEVRSELGVESNDIVILQVARLDYLKDHATALRAFRKVSQDLPQARLVLAGDGPERANIEQMICEHGLSEKVKLLGTRKDIARLLSAADIFLLSSISEGIPLTVIEAMAARLPVVATDVGGLAEVVQHEVTGLLAPARHDGVIADHILRLVQNDTLRREMGEASCRRAQEEFAEARMHDSYGRLYCEMCGAG